MIRLEKNGAIAEIELLGAEMRRYQTADGRERLWCGNTTAWNGVAPVLFPAIGAIKDGTACFGGNAYATPRHGFAKQMAFQLQEQGADFCSLTITDTPDTLAVYPFAFTLTVTHRLLEKGFVTEFRVFNPNAETMHFCLGGHPGFTCPMQDGEAFEDYIVRFEKKEQGTLRKCIPDGLLREEEWADLGEDGQTLALRYGDFDARDTFIFLGLESRKVELVHKDTGKGMRFSFPSSNTLAVWTRPEAHAPYVCLEPWNGVPAFADETGHFEDKPYHVALGPGESFQMQYEAEFD